jgi:hypothetical protein
VPADANVLEKLAPGAIEPEFHAPPSAVDVCATLSLFVHVTVPPTGTAIGFGAKAVVVKRLAPRRIETPVPAFGDGVGEGTGDATGEGTDDGVGEGFDGEEDPQASNSDDRKIVAMIRQADICLVLPVELSQR